MMSVYTELFTAPLKIHNDETRNRTGQHLTLSAVCSTVMLVTEHLKASSLTQNNCRRPLYALEKKSTFCNFSNKR